MKKNKIEAVVFDLGNVLLPFNYEGMLQKFNDIKTGLGDKFAKFYKDNYHIHRSFEKGEMTEDEFLNVMVDTLENRISKETFCKVFSDIFTVNEDLVRVLPELKKNHQLILLSNTNSIHENFGYKDKPFLKVFDRLFLSHKVGAIKPEIEIYREVENFTGLPSSKHFFTDDIEEYINGAKSAGWDAAQFIDNNSLINELKQREIL